MTKSIATDPRIDPRIKAMFGTLNMTVAGDVKSREELLAADQTEEGKARLRMMKAMFEAFDNEEVTPSAGLRVEGRRGSLPARRQLGSTSSSSGRTTTRRALRLLHPRRRHGGQCPATTATTAAWGRIIARQGVAVAMVDFRNALRASSAPEVAPFPAGLNDCVSGLKWVRANAGQAEHRSGAHRRSPAKAAAAI